MIAKDRALFKLQQQISEIAFLKKDPSSLPVYEKWRRDTEVAIGKIFGEDSRHVKDFTDALFSLEVTKSYGVDVNFLKIFHNSLDDAQAILQSLISEIEDFWDDSPEETPKNPLCILERICERFHLVARQLRSRHDGRETLNIEDEYDVQDLFHALLTLEFDDIRPEEWTPSYAGSSSRTDFLLKQERIVVEIKKTRKDLGAKQVGEQLIIDIQRYKAHPDCQSLVCFVYDPEGRITNPRGIENDLNGSGNEIAVKVIITP